MMPSSIWPTPGRRRKSGWVGLVPSSGNGGEAEAREKYYFNLSDSDLLMLLLAVGSYLDAERDLYFVTPDERGTMLSHAKVVTRLYGRLERESRAEPGVRFRR